uniref:Uncharacterized protein n=1 Tax=viral metagenome TaxID=1070528 RepID=A0A6C0JDU7_9ZZZZ
MENKIVGGVYPEAWKDLESSAILSLIGAYDTGTPFPTDKTDSKGNQITVPILNAQKVYNMATGWVSMPGVPFSESKVKEVLIAGFKEYSLQEGVWKDQSKKAELSALLGIQSPVPVSSPEVDNVGETWHDTGSEPAVVIQAPEVVVESTPTASASASAPAGSSSGLFGMLTGTPASSASTPSSTSTSSSGTKEAVTMSIKLVIDETNEYGDVLKMLEPVINTKDSVSESVLEVKPVINKSTMVPVINSEIQKYLSNNKTAEVARFTSALNKITLDPTKVDKLSQYVKGEFPTAAQLNQEIESLKGTPLFNSKYEVLQTEAKLSIKNNHPDNWWYTLSENAARNGALYRELRSEKSKTNIALKQASEGAKVFAAKASLVASAAKENLKQQYQQIKDINSADNLKIKVDTAITEFLNSTGSTMPEPFKIELVKIQSSIKSGSDYSIGGKLLLSVSEINQGGPLNKLRKLSTNLKVIKLNNKNLPMWKYGGIYAWNSPYDFMKDLLNADRNALNKFGGKRTRKYRKARTQKAGRRNKKTRRH